MPRVGPLAVDPHNIGIVGLYNVHVSSADNAKASSVSILNTIYFLNIFSNIQFIYRVAAPYDVKHHEKF